FLDFARRKIAKLERPERDADEAIYRQAEIPQHVLHLAVLAFPDRESEPDIAGLNAINARLDRAVTDAADGYAVAQRCQLLRGNVAVRAHAIAAQPPRRRQFEHAGKTAVIGQEQQAFGVQIEPANADQA